MKFRKKSLTALLMAACMIMTTPVMPVAAEETNDPDGNEAVEVQEKDTATEDESGTENSETAGNTGTEENSGSGEEGGSVEGTETGEGTGNQEETGEGSGDVTEPGDDGTVDAGAPEGDGSQASPYQIGTAEELFWFADLVNGTLQDGTAQNTYACAELTADIVFDQDDYVQHSTEWIPIGKDTASAYAGRFDGQQHTISGLISRGQVNDAIAGLFGVIGSNAEIMNLGVVDSTFYAWEQAGAIAARAEAKAQISNCWNEASDVSADTSGGIVGVQAGDCQIRQCFNTGDIGDEESYSVGGIVGINYGSIEVCSNAGKICCGQGWQGVGTGGIAGVNLGLINMSSNSGNIISYSESSRDNETAIGGIAGYNEAGIMYCYNTGTIGDKEDGAYAAGGLIGIYDGGLVISCYNYGNILVTEGTFRMAGAVAGYIKEMYRENGDGFYNCFYLTDTANKVYGYVEKQESLPEQKMAFTNSIDFPVEWNQYPEEKSSSEFASGNVAWLLNIGSEEGELSMPWRQTLSGSEKDLYPVLDGTHSIVYVTTTQKCPSAPKVIEGYNNQESVDQVVGAHDYHDTVPCSGCGDFISDVEIPKNEEGAYEIDSADDLYWFSAKVNGTHNLTKNTYVDAVLIKDITVNENVLTEEETLAEDAGSCRIWEPIGYQDVAGNFVSYKGTFEGNGYTISGLYLPENVLLYDGFAYGSGGLFGLIEEDARIRNVKVADSYFSSKIYQSVYGGIVGMVIPRPANFLGEGDELIDVSEELANANVIGCEFDGVVRAYCSGGIVGMVNAYDYVIFNCMNYGNVKTTAESIESPVGTGGIVGRVGGGRLGVFQCGNEGNIYGKWGTGGIVGYCLDQDCEVEIDFAYNIGSIQGATAVGGIVGEISKGTIAMSYNAGNVDANRKNTEGAIVGLGNSEEIYVDGLCYDTSVYNGSAVGSDSSFSNYESQIIGLPTEQFASGAVGAALNIYMNKHNIESLWYQTLGADTYPVFDPSHGEIIVEGTEDNPIFSNPEDLQFTVTVTSKINGGTGDTVATVTGGGTYKSGKEITVATTEVKGFKFLGWFNKADNSAGYKGEVVSPNLEYTFKVTKNIDLVAVYEPNGKAVLRIEGTGFTVNDGVPQFGSGYSKTFVLGEQIKLKYVGSNTFLYWKNENGKILSTNAEYTVNFLGDTTVIPVYVDKDITGYAFVEFVSYYDQIIMAETFGSNSEIIFPNGPSKMGEMFIGWSVDGNTIADETDVIELIEDGYTRITLKPVYQSSDKTYSVTIIADGDSVNTISDVSEGKQVTVSAPVIEGKQFAYWAADELGETVLSYSEDYAVVVSKDIILYAVYQDAGAEIEKKPTVALTEMTALTEDEMNKVRFVATYDVPDGYTIQEAGMIYSTNEIYANGGEEELVISDKEKEDVNIWTSSLQTALGSYSLAIRVGSATDTMIYIRGYLIVKNNSTGAIEIIYSEQAQESFETLKNN